MSDSSPYRSREPLHAPHEAPCQHCGHLLHPRERVLIYCAAAGLLELYCLAQACSDAFDARVEDSKERSTI